MTTKADKKIYSTPDLTVYGSMKQMTQDANRNGNGTGNHIGDPGTPGSCHGGFNHQYKHHNLSYALGCQEQV
jgi:hypothetical protein